jgi:sarcosine oxidase
VTWDLIVVGGGAMGLATAWQAARTGREVLVLEQFDVGHDKGSSHGAGRIFRLAYADPSYVALAHRAQVLWHELESLGFTLLTVTGGVDHGDPAVLQGVETALGSHRSERHSPAEASARWPGMRFEGSVLFQPDAGVLHADRVVAALHTLLLDAGGSYRSGARVTSVTQLSSGAAVVVEDEELRAGVVVVAAGAWAAPLIGPLVPPLRVTQEQPGFFPCVAELPVFIHHHSGTTPQLGSAHYGLPILGQGLKVGDHGTGPVVDPSRRPPVDPAAVAALEAYVAEWLPGATPVASAVDSCLYTSTPDDEFVLERHGDIVVCSPCSGHGFKFVPAIGEITARLALRPRRVT